MNAFKERMYKSLLRLTPFIDTSYKLVCFKYTDTFVNLYIFILSDDDFVFTKRRFLAADLEKDSLKLQAWTHCSKMAFSDAAGLLWT